MNTLELKVEIMRNNDTASKLALFLGMTNPTFSNKINGKGAEFTQSEIALIKERYNLSAERVMEIFFNPKVS